MMRSENGTGWKLGIRAAALLALLFVFSCTSLHEAARKGDLERVQKMIQAEGGADQADDKGRTPLMAAAQSGNPEVISALLGSGASLDSEDRSGRTALEHAYENENFETFRKLLEAGARHDFIRNLPQSPDGPGKLRLYNLSREYELVSRIMTGHGRNLGPYVEYFSRFSDGYYRSVVTARLKARAREEYNAIQGDSPQALRDFIDRYEPFSQNGFEITASRLNIRAGRTVKSEKLGQYRQGDRVIPKRVQGDWILTERGWISRTYTEPVRQYLPDISPYIVTAQKRLRMSRENAAESRSASVRERTKTRSRNRIEKPSQNALKAPSPVSPPVSSDARTAAPPPVQEIRNAPEEREERDGMGPRERLEQILQQPTLGELEAFILKYKDIAEHAPLVRRARDVYREILLRDI